MQYDGVPESAESIGNYVEMVAPRIKWIHLSDEPHSRIHSGLHIGEGGIDFQECARLLDDSIVDDTVATIEVSDGHKDDGFKKIIEHDYPLLKKYFG